MMNGALSVMIFFIQCHLRTVGLHWCCYLLHYKVRIVRVYPVLYYVLVVTVHLISLYGIVIQGVLVLSPV